MVGMQAMKDTSAEIAAMVNERLMAKSGAERIRMGSQMFDAARRMALASLPKDISSLKRKQLLFERIYGFPLPAGIAE